MTHEINTTKKSKFAAWIQATRPFAYTATATPVLIGAMSVLAFYQGAVDWFLLPFVLFGVLLLHAGGNFISEYFDYVHKVDREDTFGSSRVLTEKLLTLREIKIGAAIAFTAGVLLGSTAIFVRGDLVILWIGLVGLFCGYMYGARPFQLKYNALGDLTIFIAFGPLIVFGTYYSLTGDFALAPVYASLPVTLLVVAILHANNTRDIKHDGEANIKTPAMLMGERGSKLYYGILVFGAYAVLVALIIAQVLPIWTLLAFLSLPPATANMKAMSKADIAKPETIAELDGMTAKHHLLFGLTMSAGLLIASLT